MKDKVPRSVPNFIARIWISAIRERCGVKDNLVAGMVQNASMKPSTVLNGPMGVKFRDLLWMETCGETEKYLCPYRRRTRINDYV